MKQILFVIIILSLSLKVKAEYYYFPLSILVCEADYGAIGTIVDLDQNYFHLKVENYVLNKLELDTLKIQRFESWLCGKRYDEYKVGQKELVFFRKSNYVIDDYELLGYGAGGEFELPILNDSIYYNYLFGKLKPYLLKDFLVALMDFDNIKQISKETSRTISKEEQEIFSNKSELHKIFIECNPKVNSTKFAIPTKGYLTNLEKNYLYQDYNNKIYLFNFNIDSIFLSVKDAEVWKQDDYFIVKPKNGWTRRWVSIYSINDTNKTKVIYNQIFEVLELPEPRIYFGSYYQDTIYGHDAKPRVAHFLDEMHEDEYLDYEILSYTYIIKSADKTENFSIRSSAGSQELRERIRNLVPGDKITIDDLYVLYPNETVKKIQGRTVTVGKYE